MFSVNTNIYNKKTKGPTLMELFTATEKLKKFFLTTTDVRCVQHRWHGTHQYDIQVLATHTSTWLHRYSSLLQWSMPVGQRGHMAMEGCTVSTVRTWILYWCVPCHLWCTHWTSLIVKKKNISVFLWLWTIPLRLVLWFSCYKCL
jgi:hypothetical protein